MERAAEGPIHSFMTATLETTEGNLFCGHFKNKKRIKRARRSTLMAPYRAGAEHGSLSSTPSWCRSATPCRNRARPLPTSPERIEACGPGVGGVRHARSVVGGRLE